MKIQILAVTTLVLTATAAALTGASMAQQAPAAVTTPAVQNSWTAESLTAKYQADGFTRIEIEMGAGRAEVDAYNDTTKVEDTYDLSTGTVVKSAREQMAAGRTVTPGVFVRSVDDNPGRDGDHGGDHRDGRGSDDSGNHGSDDSGDHD